MRVSDGSLLNQTLALRDPDTALDAVRSLSGVHDPIAIDGLVELVYEHESAPPAVAAIRSLQSSPPSDVVDDALNDSLNSTRATVRAAAIEAIAARRCEWSRVKLVDILNTDQTWMVRRAALECLASFDNNATQSDILIASSDPHWRVRHSLINVLLSQGCDAAMRENIISQLDRSDDPRTAGVIALLCHRWELDDPGTFQQTASPPRPQTDPWLGQVPEDVCPFWDWDPVVLARTLHELGREGRREAIDSMPSLLFHGDERVRKPAARSIEQDGTEAHLVAALRLRDEPRHDGNLTLDRLLARISRDRLERAIEIVLAGDTDECIGRLAWAIGQVGLVLPWEEAPKRLHEIIDSAANQPARIRQAICQLVRRNRDLPADVLSDLIHDPDPLVKLEATRSAVNRRDFDLSSEQRHLLLGDESAYVRSAAVSIGSGKKDFSVITTAATDRSRRVRQVAAAVLRIFNDPALNTQADAIRQQLQSDASSYVRARALDEARAHQLQESPESETSWHVLRAAARLLKTPYWNIEPETPWTPSIPDPLEIDTLEFVPGHFEHTRPLVSDDWPVCPVGLSGHYGLPVEGYCRAAERGVNLMFWEPNYQTLTDFSRRSPASRRNAIGFTAGTFEATPDRIRKDVDRALKMLRLDSLALFLVFWVRSWQRIPDDVVEELERMRDAGLIRHFGLSTHSRTLAVEAIRDGWNPVMVRHSAVHRKTEDEVFPLAVEHGTSILTFSNTCYGRLLQPTPASGRLPNESGSFTAADCYRFTLEQSPVVACWTAPSTLEQLDENLATLSRLEMDTEARKALLKRGAWLYNEETIFRKLIREK